MKLTPVITPEIATLAPGFRAISINAENTVIEHPAAAGQALRDAVSAVLSGAPGWADAHLADWAAAFQAFGAKPKRTPCSAEALRKRVLKAGEMPAIDPIVDLYNAISLRYAIPVGGENSDAYVSQPRLAIADGSEIFDTVKEGEPAVEHPDPGEVIWCDGAGVTCRRWNWRQGVRTRLDSGAKNMWFILESLPAMPEDNLYEAADALIHGLKAIIPAADISYELVKP